MLSKVSSEGKLKLKYLNISLDLPESKTIFCTVKQTSVHKFVYVAVKSYKIITVLQHSCFKKCTNSSTSRYKLR